MKYLLDAETVIAAVKGRLPVVLRLGQLKPDDVAVSVISRLEVEAALRSQAQRNNQHGVLLKSWFDTVRLLDFDTACTQQAGALSAYLHQAKSPLPPFELLIAATAMARQLVLVSPRKALFNQVPQLDCENWMVA